MPLPRHVRSAALGAAAGLVALLPVVGWGFDTLGSRGEVLRKVTLADEDLAGSSRAEVEAAVAVLAQDFGATTVQIQAGDAVFTSTARDMGLQVDVPATVDAVMAAGRTGFALGRIGSYVGSFVGEREVAVRLAVDEATVTSAVEDLTLGGVGAPVEPSFDFRDGQFVAVDGRPGLGIDPLEVLGELRSVDYHDDVISIEVEPTEVPPKTSLADAQALVDEANSLSAAPLEVKAGSATTVVSTELLRSWLTVRLGDTGPELAIDGTKVATDLATPLAGGAIAPIEPSFVVEGDTVRIDPGQPGLGCCDPAAGDAILAALRSRPAAPVELPLTAVEPARSTAELEALGIKEKVSEFTTKHNPGEPRVKNIHLVADRMRGYIIMPGEMLSMNGVLGERTEANGFVAAPAIVDGVLGAQVGGGISQFMTTLFNASWFAGLDFGEYASHTIYISRYPYGREATINWQHPDLQVKNTTPYAVMVWPTYTDSTITVALYSTRVFEKVEQTGQTKSASQQCTSVKTERTRWYLDGRVVKDYTTAFYRPKEGFRCDGTPTASNTTVPKTSTTTTATTVAGATTTLPPATTAPPPVTTAAPPPAATAPPPATTAPGDAP